MSSSTFIVAPPRLRRGHLRSQCPLRTPVMMDRSPRPLKTARTVIVGAGPAGLSAALMLAELGFEDLTILERSSQPSSRARTRGYSFALFDRGLKMLRLLPGVMPRILTRASVSEDRKILIIRPEDIKEFDAPMNLNFPVWILRGELMAALHDTIEHRYPNLKIRWASHVMAIEVQKNGIATVRYKDRETESETEPVQHVVQADLVLACDGARSIVRETLKDTRNVESTNGFELYKTHSPAVGLSFRAVTTVPSPVIERVNGDTIPMNSDASYVLYGNSKLPENKRFKLGFQPVGPDSTSCRDGVIILKPEHEFWKVNDVDQCFKAFEENFPHLHIRQLFSKEAMQSFLSTKLGSFPSIQRSLSLVGHFKQEEHQHLKNENLSGAGVILLGDAAHAFPPDLGQGVNSALEDIFVLKNVIEASAPNDTVNHILNAYEEKRNDDIWALMHIMKHGNPYQYGQSVWGSRKTLANILLRSKLTNIAPKFFYPSIAQSFVDDFPYADFWRRSQITTRRIWAVLVIGILLITACVKSV